MNDLDAYGLHVLKLLGIVVAMSAIVALAGCAPEPPVQPVSVVAHDYCQIAAKVTWDTRDTRATIQEIRRENAKFDKRCKA